MTETGMSATVGAYPMLPQVARVMRRQRETYNTWTLELVCETGHGGFEPGQFNMLSVPAVGEIAVSLSGDVASDRLIHTVRAAGAVSRGLTSLKRGDELGLRGPFGSPWPLLEAAGKDVVVMAGGLGLAPVRPLLYRLFADRGQYRRVALLYGCRSPADILYARELNRWRERAPASVEITVDHATGDWNGRVGVVTSLVRADLFAPANAIAFICGPEVMMRFSVARLMDMGLPPEAIYLSMERNMKCALGHCGHCQFGSAFVCRDGPVFRFDQAKASLGIKEL